MVSPVASALQRSRRLFYNLGGPWYRCRLFESTQSYTYRRRD